MTEKRFNDVKGYVYDKKNCIGFIQDDYTCGNIINLLNEQHEEIEKLRKENKELEEFRYAVFKNLHKITEKEHRE